MTSRYQSHTMRMHCTLRSIVPYASQSMLRMIEYILHAMVGGTNSAPVQGRSGDFSLLSSASKRMSSESNDDHGNGKDVALPLAPIRCRAMCTSVSKTLSDRCFQSRVQQIMEVMQTLAHTISTTVTFCV